MFLPFFFSSLVLPFLIIPFLLVYCTKKQPPRPQPPRPAPPSTTSKAVVTRTGQPSSSSTAGSTPFSRVSLCASSLHQSSVPQPSIDQSCRGDTRASDVSAREMRSEVSCRTPELEYEIPVEEAVVMGQAEDHRWLADWQLSHRTEDTVSGVDVVLCPGHRIYMSDAMPQDKIKRRREVEKRVEKVGYEKMGADVPGDVDTQPSTKIVFNAPYDDKHTYHIKVTNSSARRIGWAFKTTNMKRLGVDPAAGVLDPKESTTVALTCDAFAYGQEDTNNDRVSVIWTNTPDGAAKQFSREWIQDDGMIRRKNLSIEYNP